MPSPERGVTIRAATPDDAEAMDALAVAGIATYRDFAPEGWAPPPAGEAVERTRAWLAGGDAFALVAHDAAGGQAGHVMFVPATQARRASGDPRLAHLGQLFLHRDHWGTGLAADLLHRAVAEARRRGFTAMRLFSAAGQARARRFYEREGFAVAGPVHRDDDLALEIVEYRRPLA
jgi:GNAT superfamily N-acetyltransferase